MPICNQEFNKISVLFLKNYLRKMGKCWAPGCKHYFTKASCKFFRFPKDEKLRKKWIQLTRRVDVPGQTARLCSCHFIEGKKENLPSIYKHNVDKVFRPHHLTPEVKKKQLDVHLEDIPSTSTAILEEGTMSEPSGSEDETPATEPLHLTQAHKSFQTAYTPSASLEIENDMLRQELCQTKELIKHFSTKFSYAHIHGNDKLVLLYTGFPTAHIFQSLYKLLEKLPINYYMNWNVVKLPKIDQLLVTLMKLRHNFPHDDLAVRFNVSQATITNIILTYVHVLHETLFQQLMKNIPSHNKNASCLPNCCSSFTNCRIIVDCTELYTAVPRHSMKNQSATYSSYKHRNTWKGLIGVAPNGVITFVSDLFPGSTSDKKIFQESGLLKHLQPGDLILADKGFLIRDILPPGVELNIPPFLTAGQFTEEQVHKTETIARARIHVERAIQRMKIYKILNYIPTSMCPYATIIFQVVASLTNLQYPLIKEVEEYYVE